MYIRSRKIAEMRTGLGSSSELVEQQLEALSVAINALNLVDHDSAYIVISSLVSNAPVSNIFLDWYTTGTWLIKCLFAVKSQELYSSREVHIRFAEY